MKNFIRACSVGKSYVCIFVVSLLIALISAYFSATCFMESCVNPSFTIAKWQTFNKAQKNYNIFKNAFNDQKRAVADAYNEQIDKIDKNGLETEANFTGLHFDNTIFADAVSKNSQILSYSHEATKAVDKLNKTTIATKIAKIKAFYDARVRCVYSSLRNSQKVVFSSLREYGRQPDNIQLTEADFAPVATKIVDTRVYTDENTRGALFLASIVLFLIGAFSLSICGGAKLKLCDLMKKSEQN